ncbi:MAG TPA: Sec-independent protein translocase protein TatB [Paracoccaceae bacterium]|nr:Sec-independent protein translocase protein TatB [Paracoccaceae bacterium]
MFDVGWTELLVIGVLALIVVGPRDLPQLLRTVGQWVGKIKRMAREFQRTMEDAAREADITDFKELRDLKKEMGNLDLRKQATKARSYLNQPVKSASEGAAAEEVVETASAGAAQAAGNPASGGAAEATSPGNSGGEAGESSPASAPAATETANVQVEDSGVALSDDAETRQADAKG